MSDLAALLKRVEVWTTDDYALDRDVMKATLERCAAWSSGDHQMYHCGDAVMSKLNLTSSLEDVLRLVDERLTGEHVALSRCRSTQQWLAVVGRSRADATTPEIALLAAFLRELLAHREVKVRI